MQVKITDNALARDLFPMDYHCLGDNENRPVRWMALESLLHNAFCSLSDVVTAPDFQLAVAGKGAALPSSCVGIGGPVTDAGSALPEHRLHVVSHSQVPQQGGGGGGGCLTCPVSTVGLRRDAVGADDPRPDTLRGHRPLRDVGLPEGRLPDSTAHQLS